MFRPRSPIVLGVDPGSRITGFGVITQEGSRLIHIRSGLLKTDESAPFEKRLAQIYEGLLREIREVDPDVMALESIFYSKNVRSALVLAHARGAALLAAAEMNLPVAEYSPMEVKRSTVGYGRATKDQINDMVRRLFNIREKIPPDAADALAVALCHLNLAQTKSRILENESSAQNHSAGVSK